MPKRIFIVLAVLGMALFCGNAFAQGVVPGTAACEGTSNNSIPYNALSFSNVCYMQFVAPGEFCANPPDQWGGGTTPGSGVLEPAILGGLSVRPDGPVSGFFTGTSTRPDVGTFHFLTDAQNNGNLIFFQDSLNWNATTVTYPGGFSLTMSTGDNPSCPAPTQNFQPIASTAGAFTYIGTLSGCCGSCPAPSQGGLFINFRAITGSGSGFVYMDFEFRYASVGIHYNSIRLWGVGAGATGFNNWVGFFQGLVYSFDVGGCKTYSDLYDEILDAVIVGNPPSNQTPLSQSGGGPYIKNDPGIGGIRNSLWKKAINSEAAFNRGSFGSAGNTLGALTGEIQAQDGKHLDTDSAQDLKNCVRSLAGAMGLSLNGAAK